VRSRNRLAEEFELQATRSVLKPVGSTFESDLTDFACEEVWPGSGQSTPDVFLPGDVRSTRARAIFGYTVLFDLIFMPIFLILIPI
jgi:hypothetical protein